MKDGTGRGGRGWPRGRLVGPGTWDDWLCLWRFSSIFWYKSPIHVGIWLAAASQLAHLVFSSIYLP